MRIIRAKNSGFCMGVALALRQLDEAVADAPQGTVATLGSIIHNPQVLQEYKKKGVNILHDLTEAETGMTVLIRAHGVGRQVEAGLLKHGAWVLDATCPRVKQAQLAIAGATARGQTLLLYGEEVHPEVKGLLSYAAGPCHVFPDAEALRTLLPDLPLSDRYVLAAQTTQARLIFDSMRKELYDYLGERLEVLDTICDATRQRQDETIELAGRVDLMIVAGGRESGNTRRLANIAQSRVRTLLVETADELQPEFFVNARVVGLTAGASTPKKIIDAIENRLHNIQLENLGGTLAMTGEAGSGTLDL